MTFVNGERALAHTDSRDRVSNMRALEYRPVTERRRDPLGNGEAKWDADGVRPRRGIWATSSPDGHIIVSEVDSLLKSNGTARYPSARALMLVTV